MKLVNRIQDVGDIENCEGRKRQCQATVVGKKNLPSWEATKARGEVFP